VSTSASTRTTVVPGRSARLQGLLLLLVTAVGWGVNWPVMRILLSELPPFSIRALSAIAGTCAAFAAARLAGERLRVPPGQWRTLLTSTVLNLGSFMVLSILAVQFLGASEAVIVVYTFPLWATVLAWPVLGERLTLLRVVALVLGLCGVFVLMAHGAAGEPAGYRRLPGLICGLSAAVLFALGAVLTKRRPLVMPPITAVGWQVGITAIPLSLVSLTETPNWAAVDLQGWLGCLFLSTIPLVLCYITWFRALRLLPASTASIGTLLVPAVGVFTAALALGEPLGLRQLAALGLTVGGVALAALSR
jgi:probable blue pigment (indigoidine) exporter